MCKKIVRFVSIRSWNASAATLYSCVVTHSTQDAGWTRIKNTVPCAGSSDSGASRGVFVVRRLWSSTFFRWSLLLVTKSREVGSGRESRSEGGEQTVGWSAQQPRGLLRGRVVSRAKKPSRSGLSWRMGYTCVILSEVEVEGGPRPCFLVSFLKFKEETKNKQAKGGLRSVGRRITHVYPISNPTASNPIDPAPFARAFSLATMCALVPAPNSTRGRGWSAQPLLATFGPPPRSLRLEAARFLVAAGD